MNIFQLHCFLTVANTLSFARAAEQLNVSQPTITHQIKMLENELNVKLFRRSTRFVEITPEGHSFMTDARSMVVIAEQAKRRFSTEEETPMSALSIGCSSYAELIMLSEVLNKTNKEISNFHPRLRVAIQDSLPHLLETEQVDMIFDVKEDDEMKPTIKYKELSLTEVACVCRYDHPLVGRKRIAIEELKDEPLIFSNPIHLAQEVTRLQHRLAEVHTGKNIHFCGSIDNAIAMATAGIGIAFLPEIYIMDTPLLAKIGLEDAPKLSYGMFYKSFPGDGLLKRVVQIAKGEFGGQKMCNK